MQFLNKTFALAVAVIAVTASAQVGPQAATEVIPTVKYVVSHPGGDALTYQVTLSFPGASTGTTTLRIPSSYVRATGAERGIQRLRALTPDTKLLASDDVTNITVAHPPNVQLLLAYDFAPIDTNPPNSSTLSHLPIMQPNYLHWVGPTSWVIPMIPSRGTASIRFENLPAAWSVASSFGNDRQLTFNWSPNTLAHSLVIAGDFRLITKQTSAGSQRTTLAIRGTWPVTDEVFAENLLKIIDGERRFWRDANSGDFLAALLPLEKKVFSTMAGTAFVNSFTTFVTPDKLPRDIERLWTHESMHQWLPKAFGRIEEPRERLAWFGEGFTDYYTQVLMLRWGLIGLQDFVDEFNAVLKALAESDYAMLGNEEVAAGFARSHSIQTLAYQRGMLLAASWDSDIRAASKGEKSLDDALRWLMAEQRKRPAPALNRAVIEAAVKRFGIVNPTADIDRFIEPNDAIQLRVSGSLPCVASEQTDVNGVEVGFNIAASEREGKVSGVIDNGAAYKAGLRNEQTVVRMPEGATTTQRPVKVVVRVGGAVKEVAYVPDVPRVRSIQQLKLLDAASCASFIASGP